MTSPTPPLGPDESEAVESEVVEPDVDEPRAVEPDDVEPDAAGDGEGDAPGAEPEWVRRRRLEAAFGAGEHHGGGKGDSWYRDQIPPHHG